MSVLERLHARYGPALEAELRSAVPDDGTLLSRMVSYHLGWVDADGRPAAADPGKRIRPLLMLLACEGVGGDWPAALPGAAALELVHNFTLIHDDIQDRSPERRHRPAVWVRWGVNQAINAGDGLFALAFRKLADLAGRGVSPETALQCAQMLAEACWVVCQGQVADLELADRPTATLDEYFGMVRRKTGALIGAAVGMGVLVGGCPGAVATAREFGEALGVAFQVWDDYLGIWGRREVTGKPAGDDLRERKKTLPVVWALEAGSPELRARLAEAYVADVEPDAATELAVRLTNAGAEAFTRRTAAEWAGLAGRLLGNLPLRPEIRADFADLIGFIFSREF